MLVKIVDKQRHGVSVIKLALSNVGIKGRSICVNVASRKDNDVNVGVFVSAPEGANIEPFYVTGNTIAEGVKNMLNAIKSKTENGAITNQFEITPF